MSNSSPARTVSVMIPDGDGGVPALLRRAATSIEKLGAVHVQDLSFRAEPDGGATYLVVNLSFFEHTENEPNEIMGVLGAFRRSTDLSSLGNGTTTHRR